MSSSPAPSLIWAESPLQLLSAVEACHLDLPPTPVDLRLRAGMAPLEATAAEVERLGAPPGLRLPGDPAGTARPPRGGCWIVGDVFSGAVQRGLVLPGDHRLVVVDDGLATLHLLELLTSARPRPLTRARARPGPTRRALGLAAWMRLRAAAKSGRLTVLTALPVSADLAGALGELSVTLRTHDFPWLRSRPPAAPPEQRLVVLGSSLVRNDLVRREPYVRWVRSLAEREPLSYRPHRRESPDVLAELSADPRISVAEPGVPVELSLRGLTAEHRVISLPSTALTSLRLILRAARTRIEGVPIPADWWTSAADRELRDHLSLFVGGVELIT
ncbi:hypothetical protein [Thermomonospora umbrina]|uniref:Uncharacterized protein n=1 Tax=Thermomonospora umbrina TaxID=111806 RepID=A0A3D9SR02_9ACTN|nr:hypothetical protein [Thermomonospora umbrina]REE98382.1 hypothetical protein DFJ69_3869 [Thermomonospora umbrina]